jgi:hypothetical protein
VQCLHFQSFFVFLDEGIDGETTMNLSVDDLIGIRLNRGQDLSYSNSSNFETKKRVILFKILFYQLRSFREVK